MNSLKVYRNTGYSSLYANTK